MIGGQGEARGTGDGLGARRKQSPIIWGYDTDYKLKNLLFSILKTAGAIQGLLEVEICLDVQQQSTLCL